MNAPRVVIAAAAFFSLIFPGYSNCEDPTKNAAVVSATPQCRYGCCFDPTITLAGEKLSLRGLSTFRFWGFRVHTGALYAPLAAEARAIVLGSVKKKLVLCYHRALSPEQFREKSQQVLEDTPGLNLSSLEPHLSRINAAYVGVNDGDRYAITYDPASGVMKLIFVNDGERELLAIKSPLFARYYFGIWISEHSVGRDFTAQLLGGG
jgi:hypothetical protein